MFHSKDACSKNGLRTKKSDLELYFFHVLRCMWDVGHTPLWRLWRLAPPERWMLSINGEFVSRCLVCKSFAFFPLLPSVFSSKHHLLVSHQKEGKSCCLPRSQKHYDFLTVPPYWLFTVDATCLPRTGGAALPQAVVLGLRQLTPYHPWAALQSSCLGADFQKGSSVFLFFAYDSLLLQLWRLSLILTN